MLKKAGLTIAAACLILAFAITNAQDTPQSCVDSTEMAIDNYDNFTGIWWEVARNPSPSGSWSCVKVNFTMQPNSLMDIRVTYSNTPSFLYVNQTMYTNVSAVNSDGSVSNGFNISYVNGITETPYTVYKLLNTDFNNYALFCGYTNATDPTTSFAIVLARDRFANTTVINSYENMGQTMNYANFLNGSMPTILQSPDCYAPGSAAAQYSFMIAVFATLYALLQFLM